MEMVKVTNLNRPGTQFIKPVKVIFHYSQKEDEICPATLHFMAIQDKRGKWEYMDYEECDSTTSLLKGHITHFSEWWMEI